jgi:O-antigen/teichoic acid export membrane protein
MAYRNPSGSPGHHTLAGTVRVLAAEALIFPTGLVTAAYLTRRLGADGYGVFSLAALIVTWVQWSGVSLLSRATILSVRQAEDWKGLATRILQLHLAAGLAGAAGLWLAAPLLAELLSVPSLSGYLRIFAVDVVLFVYANGHRNVVTGLGRFAHRARIVATRWLARMVLILLLVGMGLSIRGAILASIGASILELLVARHHDRPRLFARPEVSTRPFLLSAVPLVVGALALRVVQDVDLFALKAIGASTAEAGFYAAARNLSMGPLVFAAAFGPLLLSTLVRLTRDGEIEHARLMARDAERLSFALVPFAALVSGAAGGIVKIVFGPGFDPAGPILSWLVFAGVSASVMATAGMILIAGGRLKAQARILVGLVPLAIAGHLWAIPRFGALGAARVSTVAIVAGTVLTLGAVARMWGVRPPAATLARVAIVSLAAGLAAHAWQPEGWRLVAGLAVLAAAIPAALVGLGEFDRRERAAAWRALPLPRRARQRRSEPPV